MHIPQPDLRFIRIDELTDDQLAMLALLGGDPAAVRRVYRSFYKGGSDRVAKVLRDEPKHIVHEHACPLVEWRGLDRIILPNGDVETAAADPD